MVFFKRGIYFLYSKTGMRLARGVVSLVLAVLLIFVADSFPTPSFLLPADVAAISGTNLVYFQVRPSWGMVLVDRQKLDPLAETGRDLPLSLSPGVHQIEWVTPPFQDLYCQISVPVRSVQIGKNDCPIQMLTDPNAFVHIASLVSAPQMYTLKSLPAGQQKALLAALQQKLDMLSSTSLVQAGERYAVAGDGSVIQTATQTLQGEQRFVLDTREGSAYSCMGVSLGDGCSIDGNDCHDLCTVPWPGDNQYEMLRWNVAAIFHAQWTYTALDGASISPPTGNGAQQFVTFLVTWQDNAWQVAFHPQGESTFDDPNCISMIGVVSSDASYQNIGASHWVYVSGQKRADGCVAILQPNALDHLAPSTGPVLLDRFGVLLAANSMAAQRWQRLAVATASERSIAPQISAHAVFGS